MELKLVKIYRHGEDDSMTHLSIEAAYGWQGVMYRDIIQINYNGKKREAYLTVKLLNPGAGAIAERLIDIITGIDYAANRVANPPLMILEVLAEKIYLKYDEDEVRQALSLS
jgi:hypothetical protein